MSVPEQEQHVAERPVKPTDDTAAATNGAGPKKIAVIMAHPDDPEFVCAGTIARWAAEGNQVAYVLLTSGDKGSHEPGMTPERLMAIREAEQRAACEVLGVQDVVFMRQPDGMLVADLALRRELVRVIRRLKPDIVITMDPTARWFGQEYINHPDHVAAGEATLAALFPAAGNPMYFPEVLAEGLEPHSVREVYLTANSQADVYVDISDHIETKIAAIRAHASQMGDWDVETEMRKWGREVAAHGNGVGEYAEGFKYFKFE
jgi:LmbE family N-acetylglucosaminyl deacetylase